MFALALEDTVYVTADRGVCTHEDVWNLLKDTHWASDRSLEAVSLSMENSICFYLMNGFELIGFARVITDLATFAYICDVVIRSDLQKSGYGTELIRYVLSFPRLREVPQWRLKTTYAASFYGQFGFQKVSDAVTHMEYYPQK